MATDTEQPAAGRVRLNLGAERRPIVRDGAIAVDLRCCNCQYNLRTLSDRQRCPECGQPVSATVARIYGGQWDWLRSVCSAAGLLAGLANVTLVVAVCLVGSALFWDGTAAIGFGIAFLMCAACLPFPILSLTQTIRDPRIGREKSRSCWAVRRTLVFLAVLPVLFVTVLGFSGPRGGQAPVAFLPPALGGLLVIVLAVQYRLAELLRVFRADEAAQRVRRNAWRLRWPAGAWIVAHPVLLLLGAPVAAHLWVAGGLGLVVGACSNHSILIARHRLSAAWQAFLRERAD